MFIFRVIKKVYNYVNYKMKLKFCGESVYFGKNMSLVGPNFISVFDDVCISDNCKLQAWDNYKGTSTGFTPNLVIDKAVHIMSNCQISCMNKIVIGENCLLGDNVFITDNFHGTSNISDIQIPPIERDLTCKGPVIVGKNVWIGRNVCIMPNVTIGDYVIIGANSVVTHDIADYTVVAGSPAKVIKKIK